MDDLIQHLIPQRFPFSIEDVKVNDDDQVMYFKLEVQCEAGDFEAWKEDFEFLTKSNYTVRKDTTKGQQYNRNLSAFCHHNTYGVYDSSEMKHGSKNTQCPAKLCMKNKRALLDGMKSCQTEVVVNFDHNHPLQAADALRFRKPTLEIERKFQALFENGHTPASAIQAHMFDLVLNSDDDNYDLLLADNSQYPNYQWVYRLHRKQAESSYGNRNLTIKQQGELILRLASEKGCDVRLVEDGDQIAVILVTQLMKRISQMAECADMCFVDSSGGVDKDGTRFFVFLGKCHFGGVPLGVILTTSENESLLTTAFNTFKLMIPADAFGGRSNIRGPQVFMSDDSSAERNALKKSWPESILLLCTFHVLQAMWRWLFDAKHKIILADRSYLFGLVKKMLHANSKTDLGNAFSSLQEDSLAIKYPNFIAHIVSIYDRKCEWALCYREQLFVRGNNTNNICESAMMVMKDYVLQRVKAFNMVHLADFVVSRFDLYFEKKILNVAFNRLTNKLMTKQAHLQRNVEFAKNGITKIADDIYSVPSEKDHEKRYVVNMDLACCECFIGRDGKLCKHQIAVVKYIGITSRNILPLKDPKQKQYLYHIATGKHMDLTFFQSLRDDQEKNVPTEQVRDANSDECIMQDNLNLAQNVDNVEILAQNYEMEHNSIDEVTHLNSTKQNLREVFDDLLEKLESKPELYLSSVDKFVTTYKSFKTDTNINSALHNFGKTLNECNTSASVYASKRRGKKIRVQPTAISRRHHIALGKGSTSAANTGRPRKPKVLNEHTYTAYRELKKAPHNLTKCVASNRSIGKTH